MDELDDDPQGGGKATDPQSPNGDMTDRDGWEARAVFRETYLSLYAEPEIREAYRRVGIAFYEGALAREESYVDRGAPPVAVELRAAARI